MSKKFFFCSKFIHFSNGKEKNFNKSSDRRFICILNIMETYTLQRTTFLIKINTKKKFRSNLLLHTSTTSDITTKTVLYFESIKNEQKKTSKTIFEVYKFIPWTEWQHSLVCMLNGLRIINRIESCQKHTKIMCRENI